MNGGQPPTLSPGFNVTSLATCDSVIELIVIPIQPTGSVDVLFFCFCFLNELST